MRPCVAAAKNRRFGWLNTWKGRCSTISVQPVFNRSTTGWLNTSKKVVFGHVIHLPWPRALPLPRSFDSTESLRRRSRCCDGDAQTSSVALILRVASTS